MARNSLTDYLQDFPFWVMDVAPIEGASIPIFMPLSGFASVSSPEISFEQETIVEGNWFFKNKVIKRAEVTSMTLRRGATLANSDFWRWSHAALTGDTSASFGLSLGGPTPRRQLVLIQFLSRIPFISTGLTSPDSKAGAIAAGLAATGVAAQAGVGNAALAAGLAAGSIGMGALLGGADFALRAPAKAWILYGCIPTRYEAASDFDASSGAVSMQELEIAVEYLEEFSLGA
jgi:phage tail-like protein